MRSLAERKRPASAAAPGLSQRPRVVSVEAVDLVARARAARQEDSLLESQMQLGSLQYPHNPMKGASEHFHFLSVLAGTYDDTVRNIDIDRAGYLRHSFIAGFPTERVPKMPLSGVSTRFGRPGSVHLQGARRHDDGCVHPPDIAYQLVTLSGTGVSVLD